MECDCVAASVTKGGQVRSAYGRLRAMLAGGAALAVLAAALGPVDAAPQLPPAKHAKNPAAKPKPLQMPLIAISIGEQRLTVFDKGTPVEHAPVSTGMQGHSTPMGVFSIIGKEVFHRSNIYSGAPMPFMQRITWSGVALHAGVLPGYPASHGCIRMPPAFAVKLYGLTRLGARVIVARGEVKPVAFEDAHLFTKLKPVEDKAAMAAPSAEPGAKPVRTAEGQTPVVSDVIAGATAAPKDASKDAATDAKAGEGATGTVVVVTPVPIVPAQPVETHGTFTMPTAPLQTATPLVPPAPATAPVAPAVPAATAPAAEATKQAALEPYGPERPLRPGPITVFVSKKEGKVYIRKGFQPIFSAPVTIAEPARPLGTHIYTAVDAKADGVNFDWQVVSLPGEVAKKAEVKVERDKHGHRVEKVVAPPAPPSSTAAEALARIELPATAQWKISSLMSTGAALIISDQGLGGETGTETDFIVLTH